MQKISPAKEADRQAGPLQTRTVPDSSGGWASESARSSARQVAQAHQMAKLQSGAADGLPGPLRAGIEALTGQDMSGVRVHRNSSQPAQLNALAYAQGSDIHLGPGQERHLPHEAWHVLQQRQGRVRPTTQMAGLAINTDAKLEAEAEAMGRQASAESEVHRMAADSPGIAGQRQARRHAAPDHGSTAPIQGIFVPLTETRILHVQSKAKERGEDLDVEYLQGLLEREADQHSGVTGADAPELFVPLLKISQAAACKDTGKALAPPEMVYAKVEQLASYQDERVDLLQHVADTTLLYRKNEAEIGTIAELIRWMSEHRDTFADPVTESTLNDLVGSAVTGGAPLDADSGNYGSIEFRFKSATGDIYVLESADQLLQHFKQYETPALRVLPAQPSEMQRWRYAYEQARLPYTHERSGADYLFVEESLIGAFSRAVLSLSMGHVPDLSAQQTTNAPEQAPGLAAPIANPKTRQKSYTHGAVRGSRGTGQKAAMGNYSAKDYVRLFNADAAASKSWEWLHIQGARLGGPNRPENLVAGTAEANTQMIPYERAIHRLSRTSTPDHPVRVIWSATLRQDSAGTNTHIGDRLTIDVEFPNAAPAETDSESPTKLKSIFPVTVNATGGASFTKLDRDNIEANARK